MDGHGTMLLEYVQVLRNVEFMYFFLAFGFARLICFLTVDPFCHLVQDDVLDDINAAG